MLSTQISSHEIPDDFYEKASWSPDCTDKNEAVIWLTRYEQNLCLVNTSKTTIEEIHALRVVFKVARQHRFVGWGDLGIKKSCNILGNRYCVIDDWDPERDAELVLGIFLRFRFESIGVRTVETEYRQGGIIGLPIFNENFVAFKNVQILTEWIA